MRTETKQDPAIDLQRKRTLSVQILHSRVPGRIRFQARSLYHRENKVKRVYATLVQNPGILKVSINSRTATVLVHYNTQCLSAKDVLKLLKKIIRKPKQRATSQMSSPFHSPSYDSSTPHLTTYPLPTRNPMNRQPKHAWHVMSPETIAQLLETSPRFGLSEKAVQNRIKKLGLNTLTEREPHSELDIFLNQYKNLPSLLLLGSAAVSTITSGISDSIAILMVLLINGFIGYKTESTAEKTISSLTRTEKMHALVIRDGKRKRLLVDQLTMGDLIILTPGTVVGADARLCESQRLSVDESMLTGESLPVLKSTEILTKTLTHSDSIPLGDRTNMVFRGTVITGGSGLALVVATGDQTETGKIQKLLGESKSPSTPLQKQMRFLGNQMAALSISVSLLTFLLGILHRSGLLKMINVSVSLAVAAIPESLPTIATTTLARGIKNLRSENLLVRHLDAIETLGNVDVICFDKTGTLTQNRMTVIEILTLHKAFEVNEKEITLSHRKFVPFEHPELQKMAEVSVLCNEASYSTPPQSGEQHSHQTLPQQNLQAKQTLQGSATEIALIQLGEKLDLNLNKLRSQFPTTLTQYRSEKRSYMTTLHRVSDTEVLNATKGNPADVLALCQTYQKNGKILPLSQNERKKIISQNDEMAEKGLRVLGIAYQQYHKQAKPELLEDRQLIWLGLIGMIDPIRPKVQEVIRQIHSAKIRTVMITGDQAKTAEAIGKTLGLSEDSPLKLVDAKNLVGIPTNTLNEVTKDTHVFARVNPSQKLQIIQALQHSGQVVAMVGDGVNDGPALKVADIGIAMGGKGTEVAAQVADIVLVEERLSKIILGIIEGRTIQDDIKKAVDYILTQNLAEIIFMVVSIALGWGEPLTAMQLLWMNLLTDIFPELALAQEKPEEGILQRKPEHEKERFFSKEDLTKMVCKSILLATPSLANYYFAAKRNPGGPTARTLGFTTLVTGSLLYTLSARSEDVSLISFGDSRHHKKLPENKYIPLAIGVGFIAELIGILNPWISKKLGTTRLGLNDTVLAGFSSFVPLFWIEILKLLRNEQPPPLLAGGGLQGMRTSYK